MNIESKVIKVMSVGCNPDKSADWMARLRGYEK